MTLPRRPVLRSSAILALSVLPLVVPHRAVAQTGSVQGTILSGAAAQPGVRVTLFNDSLSTFRELRTSAAGSYLFPAVPPGPYRLGVALPGKAYTQVDVTIAASGIQRDFSLIPETAPGRWDIIGSTLNETFDASNIGILLADGRVMFCHDTVDPVLFNPVTGQSTLAATSGQEQGCMNLTLLADGRVLMVGGQGSNDFRNAVRFVKAYNPATNTWASLPWLNQPNGRWYPGMARLADGSLLTMGGGTCCNAARTASSERLDLATMTWSFTGPMLNPSEFTPCALLYTGEVLITQSPPQLYNPTSGQFRLTGPFVQPAQGYPDHAYQSLIVLADGRAVVIGIRPVPGQTTAMAEVYTPATGTWAQLSSPALVRSQPEVVQLPDGKVLVAAGDTQPASAVVPNVLGVVKWTDLFDPAANTWRRVADMNQFREYHAVTLLIPDGRVITTGGSVIEFGNPPNSTDIEGFSPPYLFRGVRPQIASVSTTTPARGATLSATVFPATQITSAVLVGTSATTHWVDAGVPRRLVLSVTQTGSNVSLTLPTDANMVPLGHYMLFLMVDDIPSVARIVRVLPRCAADFNGVDGVSVQDIFDFLDAFFANSPAADINASGAVTVQDIFDFIAAFFAGC